MIILNRVFGKNVSQKILLKQSIANITFVDKNTDLDSGDIIINPLYKSDNLIYNVFFDNILDTLNFALTVPAARMSTANIKTPFVFNLVANLKSSHTKKGM